MRRLLILAIAAAFIITAGAPADARRGKAKAGPSSSRFSPTYTGGGNQGDGPPWPQLNHW
jgi:hypothetical protein